MSAKGGSSSSNDSLCTSAQRQQSLSGSGPPPAAEVPPAPQWATVAQQLPTLVAVALPGLQYVSPPLLKQ